MQMSLRCFFGFHSPWFTGDDPSFYVWRMVCRRCSRIGFFYHHVTPGYDEWTNERALPMAVARRTDGA